MMLFVRILFIVFLLASPNTFAQSYMDSMYSKPRIFSADIQYIYYNDILSNSSGQQLDLESTLNANLNIRFYRTFSLMAIYGKASTWSYAGVGLRMDLPGFWFISGIANDFVRRKKLRNANTYIHASKLIAKDPTRDKFVDDRMGFGADLFLMGDLYFNFELNIQSHEGNQFFAPAVGIGYEF